MFTQSASRPAPRIIESAEDLNAVLGDEFVLFLGSAVSGQMEPCLPMIHDVRRDLLTGLASTVGERSSYERLLRRCALALAANQIGQETKFEEMLWFIETRVGISKLNDLLALLYVCELTQCGANAAAIGALLNSPRCTACFTTNFDNTVELVCPGLRTYIVSEDRPDNYPSKLPKRGESPVLVKLHGDAKARNCAAMSPQLYQAARSRAYQNLPRLLNGKRVLVLGYSGEGDIDIAPHLASTSATFLWANHNLDILRRNAPKWASYGVHCNLRLRHDTVEPGKARNLLLDLAVRTELEQGRIISFPEGASHAYPPTLQAWCRTSGIDLEQFVRQFLRWRAPWPIMQLHHARGRRGVHDARYWREYNELCSQVQAFKSALAACKQGLEVPTLTIEDEVDLGQGMGYALWRMGDLKTAQSILLAALNKDPNSRLGVLKSDVCQLYLQVSRDILHYTPNLDKRRQLYRDWHLDQAIRMLQDLPKPRPEDALLAEIIEYDIRASVGDPVPREIVERLYDDCASSKYQGVASRCAEVLVQMSLREGLPYLLDATRSVIRIRLWHYVYKNAVAGLTAIVSSWLPRLLPFGFRIHQVSRWIAANLFEVRYRVVQYWWKLHPT